MISMGQRFQPPRGTRDFLPEQMNMRKKIVEIIETTFKNYGFLPIDTPAFEDWKLLAAKGSGGETIKDEIYYFRDKSNRELGLRFDLTVPTARVVASNPQLPRPFKRYQIGPVWRYDKPQAGRFREFLQADADIFGSPKMDCEAECISVAADALKKLGFNKFLIRLNNRKILNGLVELAGIKKPIEAFRVLDKLEKIGKGEVLKQLKQFADAGAAERLIEMISIKGRPEAVLSNGRKLLKGIRIAEEGLNELEEIIEKSKVYGTADKIIIDFSLVRGLDYYTGPIFEISINSKASIGSIAGGGRYDNLIGLYSNRPEPATGFSFGVERIAEAMKISMPKTNTKVFVVAVNEKLKNEAIRIAQKLRAQGISSETDLMGRDIRKQLEYANSCGIPFALFVGKKELKENKFTLRDMKTGKERKVRIDNIGKEL